MKSTELMIGDWVYNTHNRKPEQVCEIMERMVMLDYNDLYDYDDLEPIPITAEILKANGFMPDDLCGYAEKYVCPVEIKKIPQTILEFTFYEGISADTLFKCWTKPESCDGENSVHICDLKYVHQLQHALRLCEIDMEIKLED